MKLNQYQMKTLKEFQPFWIFQVSNFNKITKALKLKINFLNINLTFHNQMFISTSILKAIFNRI